jgi:hypothetical protein
MKDGRMELEREESKKHTYCPLTGVMGKPMRASGRTAMTSIVTVLSSDEAGAVGSTTVIATETGSAMRVEVGRTLLWIVEGKDKNLRRCVSVSEIRIYNERM